MPVRRAATDGCRPDGTVPLAPIGGGTRSRSTSTVTHADSDIDRTTDAREESVLGITDRGRPTEVVDPELLLRSRMTRRALATLRPWERRAITAAVVRRLIAAQFPQWSDLDVVPVDVDGWDNSTFRLGDDMSVRLPTGDGYAAQVPIEAQWLPRLAPRLPLPIPEPIAVGRPDETFPLPWSVRRWLSGSPAASDRIDDPERMAVDLAGFLTTLQRIDPRWSVAGTAQRLPRRRARDLRPRDRLGDHGARWRDRRRSLDRDVACSAGKLVGSPGGLDPRRHHRIEPARRRRPSACRHRLRLCRRRRSGLRSDHRLDSIHRDQPTNVPAAPRPGRGDVGTGPRVGTLESADHTSRRHQRQCSPTLRMADPTTHPHRRPPDRFVTTEWTEHRGASIDQACRSGRVAVGVRVVVLAASLDAGDPQRRRLRRGLHRPPATRYERDGPCRRRRRGDRRPCRASHADGALTPSTSEQLPSSDPEPGGRSVTAC